MTSLAIIVTATVLVAGFLASWLPGYGVGELWTVRLRIAEANTSREHITAYAKGVGTVALMIFTGIMRLTALVVLSLMIFGETLTEHINRTEIPSTPNEKIQGEIENG
jgi:hypothetical protein